MIQHERFAKEPADGGAVLEKRVHPWIWMRISGRRGAVDGVTAGARAHEHHGHAVGEAAVDGLEFLVIEGVLAHDGDESADDLLIGDRPCSSQCASRCPPRLRRRGP